MTKQIRTIEISVLKVEDLKDINRRMQVAADEENRLMDLLTDEDNGTSPELQAVQKLRDELFEEANGIVGHYEEITYFRGYSFIDKFFNKDKSYRFEYEITQEDISKFITECNLALENPEVSVSILPFDERMEPSKTNEEYIANIRHAKEVFTDVLNNTDWVNDSIFLRSIR